MRKINKLYADIRGDEMIVTPEDMGIRAIFLFLIVALISLGGGLILLLPMWGSTFEPNIYTLLWILFGIVIAAIACIYLYRRLPKDAVVFNRANGYVVYKSGQKILFRQRFNSDQLQIHRRPRAETGIGDFLKMQIGKLSINLAEFDVGRDADEAGERIISFMAGR